MQYLCIVVVLVFFVIFISPMSIKCKIVKKKYLPKGQNKIGKKRAVCKKVNLKIIIIGLSGYLF